MELNNKKKILIVGLGLLGGSYAKALKRQGFTVYAITKEQKSIDYALKNNIIDCGKTTVEKDFLDKADIIVFALYPHVFTEWVQTYGHLIKSGTILTDVTGVKECVVYKIQALLPCGVEFIAAHPMAGREVFGVENADDSIFKDANYIVVPTEKNSEEAIELCKQFGKVLGFAKISTLNPQKHDEMIAFLSQLTHCIAVCLMCANADDSLVQYTGDSFSDLTRIANINDDMWSELFLLNKNFLLKEMEVFEKSFNELYNYIKTGDREGMREMMRLSSSRRKKFNKGV